jgi:L-ascorbate metabolism protein UlaG (beta-lactamase superfamily)
MRLTFFGHAAFLIETNGLRIILDPFRSPECGGYAPIDEPADLVVLSHENDKYHSHLGQIVPPFDVLRALEFPPEGQTWRGISFQAIRVFETPEKLPDDEVTVIHFKLEDMHIVLLGDLGHKLTETELSPIQGADIVLAAVGGPPTIKLPELKEVLEAIEPRVVVPMHYLTPRINLKIQPVEDFLNLMSDWRVDHDGGSTIELTKERLGPGRRIVRLEPSR